MNEFHKKEKIVLSIIIILFLIFATLVYTTPLEIKKNYQKILSKPVPADSLRVLTTGEFIMESDSILYCVKNKPQKELTTIIAYSAYGKRKLIILGTSPAKKIVKIIRKSNPAYCQAAKKFLSTQ